MSNIKAKILEKLRNNFFKIIYLILLTVLLAFIIKKEQTDKSGIITITQTERLVEENEK